MLKGAIDIRWFDKSSSLAMQKVIDFEECDTMKEMLWQVEVITDEIAKDYPGHKVMNMTIEEV
jgi:hypothetical protein